MDKVLKIMKVRDAGTVPKRSTSGSAGLDLCACIDSPVTIHPGEILKMPTGIAVAPPDENYVSLIFARSGLSTKHGIGLANSVGVVDSDYRGEIIVALINQSQTDYEIAPNERIAQLAVMPVCCLPVSEVEELDSTLRGDGGFGSTGKA